MTFRSSVPVSLAGQYGAPSGPVTVGGLENEGTSAYIPHADHGHAFPAATGESAALAAAKADGVSPAAARADHVHPHVPGDHESGGFADLTGVFAGVDASKRLNLTGPTDTAATAGTATALPAAPAGYVEAVIGGATKKIAYYD